MLRPQFARDQVSDLVLEGKHVQNLLRALPIDSSGWTPDVDLSTLFFRLTLGSTCEFLFGESVDSQLLNLPGTDASRMAGNLRHDDKTFASCFDNSQLWLGCRIRMMDQYWLINGLDFRRSNKYVHDFVDYFVELALKKISEEKRY
jgi:hypothetical protein